MTAVAVIVYGLWGAFWWRVRGGAWETLLRLAPGTTQARMATAAALALPLLFLDAVTAAAALAMFAGMASAGWGDAHDIGRVAGRRLLDTLMMSGWGLVTVAPSAFVLAIGRDADWIALLAASSFAEALAALPPMLSAALSGGAWWSLAVAGIAMGPVYALAWWLGDLGKLPELRGFATASTQWAEIGTGFGLALALYVS